MRYSVNLCSIVVCLSICCITTVNSIDEDNNGDLGNRRRYHLKKKYDNSLVNQNDDDNRNKDDVFQYKKDSGNLNAQQDDVKGSDNNYNAEKKVKVRLRPSNTNNEQEQQQSNNDQQQQDNNVPHQNSYVKRSRKRMRFSRDNNNVLKFNEIARNADTAGGNLEGVQDNAGVQQAVQVVDSAYARKDQNAAKQGANEMNRIQPMSTTYSPYNQNRFNVQSNNEEQSNQKQASDNNQQPAIRANNQYQKDSNIPVNSNSFKNNNNVDEMQNSQQKSVEGANQKQEYPYKKADTGANQNSYKKVETLDSQNSFKQSETGAKKNSYQKADTGANQNSYQKADANQNSEHKADTGANQNSFQKVDHNEKYQQNQGQNDAEKASENKRFNDRLDGGSKRSDNFDTDGIRRIDDSNREGYARINSDFKQGVKKSKGAFPKGKSRPDTSARKDVMWMEEYHSFSLRASVDNRFRIRYAPIPAEGSPWPLPQFYRPGETQFLIKPQNLKFNAAGETCDILDFAFERVKKNMFGGMGSTEEEKNQENFRFFRDNEESPYQELKNLNVTVLRECGLFPQLDMDESYDLEVRKTGAVIIAREVWGAIRGLETFSQLVHQDAKSRFVVNRTMVHDYPRFKHRGILLDTSRHYLNKETILLNLEAMAQNKMNVFHWHIVDEQSFPFDCHTYPNLTKMGAYSPAHIYTHEVVLEIINEARLRGIRVIPEFDTPGHTFAWGLGTDNLLTNCYNYAGQPDGYFGPINPILKSTYRFLTGLFSEVLGLFKDKYVHLGGDEVSLDCWQTNPYLQRFMSRNKLYDVKDLLNVYERKLVDIVENLGKKRKVGSGYITWQEVFDDGVQLKPDAIVQIWKGDAWDIDRVTSKGYRALYSTCWYLDYINYGQDWDKYYKCEQIGPHLEMYNVRNESLLLGGDVCLWTEFADDESIMPRLWPRASAAAERLWSNKEVMDAEAAAPRIEAHRCRMKSRGIPVGVLSGPGYCNKHSKPDHSISSLFDWVNKKADNIFSDKSASTKNIYVVDMNAMYLVPLIIVVCLVCMVILSSVHQTPVQKKFLTVLTFPVSGTRRSVRGLIYIFMVFAVLWCVWTAPIWLHAWENNNKLKK